MQYHGFGTDLWTIPFDAIYTCFQALYALFALYIFSRDLVRLSILLFYLRIFQYRTVARALILATFAMVVCNGVAFSCVVFFACRPVDGFWTGWDGEHPARCVSNNLLFWAGAVIVTFIDIWIIVIPLLFVARLKLGLRNKVLASAMFAFGLM